MLRKQVPPSLPSLSTPGQTHTHTLITCTVRGAVCGNKGEAEGFFFCPLLFGNMSPQRHAKDRSHAATRLLYCLVLFNPGLDEPLTKADLWHDFSLCLSLSHTRMHTHMLTHTHAHTKIHSERVFLLCLHTHTQTCTQALLSSLTALLWSTSLSNSLLNHPGLFSLHCVWLLSLLI